MRCFPPEFEDLLTPSGRRLLAGQGPWVGALGREGRRFLASSALLARDKAASCLTLLERHFPGKLERMEQGIPPESTWGMQANYSELLPKCSRVSTALLEKRRERAYATAEATGLLALLRSESFRRFAEVLNGRALRRTWGVQLLCYGAGDYAGPHNDHHPEDVEARDGYLDVHLTFSNAAVRRQLLVYERRGHLSEVASVRTVGGLTAYRLPFWHLTTPLEARRGRERDARRWVLLGTFLDAPARRGKGT